MGKDGIKKAMEQVVLYREEQCLLEYKHHS